MMPLEDAADALRALAPPASVAEVLAILQPHGYYDSKPHKASDDLERVREALTALSTPPADDVRELVERMRRASRAVYLATDATVADDISDMLRRAADVLEVRPRGTVTEDERAAINVALIRGLPLWVSAAEEGHARKALLDGIVHALQAAREVRS